MNIRTQLLSVNSKNNNELVVNFINDKPQHFSEKFNGAVLCLDYHCIK